MTRRGIIIEKAREMFPGDLGVSAVRARCHTLKIRLRTMPPFGAVVLDSTGMDHVDTSRIFTNDPSSLERRRFTYRCRTCKSKLCFDEVRELPTMDLL